jgi:hypothetical protein
MYDFMDDAAPASYSAAPAFRGEDSTPAFAARLASYYPSASPLGIFVVLLAVWHHLPFTFLLLYAALLGVPKELYEAARVDGASAWTTFRRITLPVLLPGLLAPIILVTLVTFEQFELPLIPLAESIAGVATQRQQVVDHASGKLTTEPVVHAKKRCHRPQRWRQNHSLEALLQGVAHRPLQFGCQPGGDPVEEQRCPDPQEFSQFTLGQLAAAAAHTLVAAEAADPLGPLGGANQLLAAIDQRRG